MRVLLDRQPCEMEASCVGAAIAGAAAIVEQRGRILVQVVVDGAEWDEEQLGSAEWYDSSADEVALTSADLRGLVGQTLAGGSEALLQADQLQREAAQLLQVDRRAEAMTRLGEALTIWQHVHEAVVKSADALEIDLELLEVGDGTIQQSLEQLSHSLRTLRRTLSKNDPVGVSDTLLYDLPEAVSRWREVVHTMLQHIERLDRQDPPQQEHGA